MQVYLDNPFFDYPRSAVLGSSLMNEAFFERVEHSKRDERERDVEAAILGSSQIIKGTDAARQFCLERGVEPYVIQGLDPDEVLDVLERCRTFVYLPRALEPAGRMLLESRFLGCDVVANAHTGVCGESWWNLDDERALEVVRDAPSRFWRLVRRFVREAEASGRSDASSARDWVGRLLEGLGAGRRPQDRVSPTLETEDETVFTSRTHHFGSE
jgi:hypothetical protein